MRYESVKKEPTYYYTILSLTVLHYSQFIFDIELVNL